MKRRANVSNYIPGKITAIASRPVIVAVLVFITATYISATLVWRSEMNRLKTERARVAALAGDHTHAIQQTIERALSSTYALAALVQQGDGDFINFDAVARRMLPFYQGTALGLAPGGIVKSIVPLAGNEGAIGHDMLHDPARSRESVLAKESKKLTLAGPFKLIQGGVGAVGRLPVYLDDGKGKASFWGFTTVLIRFPETLEPVGLSRLVKRGFYYELWRTHPDTGEKQIITASSSVPLVDPVERSLELPNGTWMLSLAPVNGWSAPKSVLLKSGAGLLFSLMFAYIARLLVEQNIYKEELEAQVVQRTAELQARETELKRAQSLARVGSWVLDLTTNERRWSAEAYRIFGVNSSTALTFEALLEWVHPDDRDAVLQTWQGALTGERYDIEYRLVVGDVVRWVHEQVELAFGKEGKLLSGIGTVQDITERKRAGEALIEKNTELERFTYTVSHDLKSPLITIQSYIGMINKDMDSGNYVRVRADMKRIEDAATKMTALLGDLLELSRIGRLMNAPLQIDMNRLVKDVLGLLAGPLGGQNIELVIGQDLPGITGDYKRITEVFQNLIENAIKYMGEQTAPRIEIGAMNDGVECVYFVKDNGKGIDPRYHENIFGLFNKLDVKSAGTGIGLALVKRIIEVHGGRVWVESEGAGMGSTFCFTVGWGSGLSQ